MCPYKGIANCECPESIGKEPQLLTRKDYNVVIDGKEHKDLIWWYRHPTAESAPIAGHLCFYNEKVDIYIDGVQEDK